MSRARAHIAPAIRPPQQAAAIAGVPLSIPGDDISMASPAFGTRSHMQAMPSLAAKS